MKNDLHKKTRFIWRFLKPYFSTVISGIVCTAMKSLCVLIIPIILAAIIDEVFYNKNTMFFINAIVICVFLFVGYIIVWLMSSYNWFHLLNKFVVDIRVALFKKIMKTRYSKIENKSTGDLETVLTSDATQFLDEVHSNYIDIVNNIISYIISAVIILSFNLWIALLVIAFVPISLLLNRHIGNILKEYSRRRRNKYGSYVSHVAEFILGMRELRLFNLFSKTKHKIFKDTSEIIKFDVRVSKLNFIAGKINEFLDLFLDISIYIIVAVFIFRGKMSVGEFIAILAYVQTSKASFSWLINNYVSTQARKVSINNVINIFTLEDEESKNNQPDLSIVNGEIAFEKVSFHYNEQANVLENISFDIQAGERVALIGFNGIGKTTIAKLLLGLYRPQTGRILIDGQNIENFSYSSLRRSIGIVQQDIRLFNGSIRSNLTFGNENYDDDLIWKVCAKAQIDSCIKKLPDGLDTDIDSLGFNLSYGEKQRIMIARLLLKNPKIIILDEATSSLDAENELEIFNNLLDAFNGQTMLIISHCTSVLKYCSKIMIINHKKIEMFDNNSQELKENEYYQNLMQSMD